MTWHPKAIIVLDTFAIRSFVEGDANCIDIALLKKYAKTDEVTIHASHVAKYELLDSLLSGRLSWRKWRISVPILNEILYSRFQFFPDQVTFLTTNGNEPEAIRYCEETTLLWYFMAEAPTLEDFKEGGEIIWQKDGQEIKSMIYPNQILEQESTFWAKETQEWGKFLSQFDNREEPPPTRDHLFIQILNKFIEYHKMDPKVLQNNEGILRIMVNMIIRRLRGGYKNPRKYGNDVYDMKHLFILAGMAQAVIIMDNKFIQRFREADSVKHRRMLSVEELNIHLRQGTILNLAEQV